MPHLSPASRRPLVLAALLVPALAALAALAVPAAAAPAPRPPPPLPSAASAAGKGAVKALHNVDWLMHRNECIADEGTIPGHLDQADGAIAQIPDPAEKQAFEAWVAAARAYWKAESEGPPGVGTWKELAVRQHAFAERMRLLGQHKVATAADQDALYQEVQGIVAEAAADHALVAGLATPCGHARTAGWARATEPAEVAKDLNRTLSTMLEPIADPVSGLEQRMARLAAEPAPQAMLDVADHLDDLHAILNDLPAVEIAAHQCVRWGALLDTPGDHWWGEAEQRIAALDAGVGPMLDKMLAGVAMPAEVGGGGRPALARRLVKDAGKVLAVRATSDVRDEDHDVPVGAIVKYRGKTYLVRAAYREHFASFDVRWVTTALPERWASLPGVQPGQLCAIRGAYIRKYSAGKNVRLGVWTLEEEHDFAPMLCKNARETSTLR